MDFRVIFSPTSIRDLADSVAFIARHDSEAAARVGGGLINSAENHLSKFPLSGPACREYPAGDVRYWLHRDYRIVYEVDEARNVVSVLRFWHCSRGDWPVDLSE